LQLNFSQPILENRLIKIIAVILLTRS